jgi:hypothetical protein
MLTAMLAAVALLADTTPAAAAAAARPAAAQPVSQVKAADNDIVCHKEYPTGSNIPKKVCRSKSEEAAAREEARKQVEKLQLYTPRPPGG